MPPKSGPPATFSSLGVLVSGVIAGCGALDRAAAFDSSPLPNSSAPVPLRFVVCSDTRSRLVFWRSNADEARAALTERIIAQRPSVLLNAGDLVAFGDSPSAWAAFDRLTAPLRDAKIKVLPALGNHEYLGVDSLALEAYFRRFPDLLGRKWYSYDVGVLRLLVVDSNFDSLDDEELRAQREWVHAELARADADGAVRFVLVACHHPPYTNGPHPPETRVLEDLLSTRKGSAKLRGVISGHVHTYERFEIDGLTFVVSGGCGAPLTEVDVDAASWRTRPAYEGPSLRSHHLLSCEIDADGVTCSADGVDGAGWRTIDWFRFGG